MAAATSDFWERRGTSEEGVVAVEVGAGRRVGDRRRSALRAMKRNLVNAGASRLDDVLLMRMDSGSCPLKGTLRQGSRNGRGVEVRGAARRASERSVALGRIGRYDAVDYRAPRRTLTAMSYFWDWSGAGDRGAGGD
ncbi:uncharacterized protein WM294_006753 [Sarcoramphus papa]